MKRHLTGLSLGFRAQLAARAQAAIDQGPPWTAAQEAAVANHTQPGIRLTRRDRAALTEQPARPARNAEGGISVRAAPRATTPTAIAESYRSSADPQKLAESERALIAAGIIPARK